MAINFPASPSTNDTFTAGSITYKWDGAKWIGLGVTPADRLVEGSNSLEIDANNDLVWTGNNLKLVDGAETTASLFIGGTKKSSWQAQNNFGTILYSYDNEPLIFSTSSASGFSEKLRITTDGKVGINDTDPRTGLTIAKYGTAPTTNANTYSMPAGRWVSTWNTSTSNNVDYWAGFGGGGYGVSSGSVNIALAPNHNNTSQQAGMYIAGEATSASSSVLTIGKLVSGSAIGSSDVAGNQRASKSELLRVTSDGTLVIGTSGLTNNVVYQYQSIGNGLIKKYYVIDTLDNGQKTRFTFAGTNRTSCMITINASGSWTASNTSNNHPAAQFVSRVMTNSSGDSTDSSTVTTPFSYIYSTGSYAFNNAGSFGYSIEIANPTGDSGVTFSYEVIIQSAVTSSKHSLISSTTA